MKAPNGRTYDIEGPAGATEEQVRTEILRRDPTAGMPSPFKPGERESYISAPKPPSEPAPGPLNPHPDPVGSYNKYGTKEALETARKALAYPYKLAGKLDVKAGNRTPEQADRIAQLYGDLTGLVAGGRLAAPMLAPKIGAGAGAAKEGANALSEWASKNPVQAFALYELLKQVGLGGISRYLPHGGEK